jgi:DNA-binding XRE family transcriptional regulator
MTTKEMTKQLQPKAGIEHEALTMAVGIFVRRVQELPKVDQDDLHELLKALSTTDPGEDRESIVGAMMEILENAPGRVRPMELSGDDSVGPGLRKWIGFVGQKIRDLRKAAGLTQEELAEKSGLPQSHISRLERNEHSPSRVTLEKIAAALKVPLSDLDPSA